MNWQNVNFGILTVFRTIINYCWKGGMACCETDTTKNSRWYYVWMIDDRWLVSLTTSRQSHLQTCLFADDCIMYGQWLCRPTARPWCFSRVGIQVGWWIPSSEMQCPECIKIQTPFRPLPQANRTHHEYWRCNKVPGCQPQCYRFLEDTHRNYLQ